MKPKKDPIKVSARIQAEMNALGRTPRERWVQERSLELIEQFGGVDKVPKSMRRIIKKSKQFSHVSERPRRK